MPNFSEPVKITLEPASSPSFLLIKLLKFEFQPTSSISENWACQAMSQRLIYCEPKIQPEPSLVPPLVETSGPS